MKRSVLIVLVIACVALVGMVGYIFFGSSLRTSSSSSVTNTQANSKIPVKDYAPSLPMNQKTTILIQHSDSSEEKYIVPTSQVDMYSKSLPEGDHVISKTP